MTSITVLSLLVTNQQVVELAAILAPRLKLTGFDFPPTCTLLCDHRLEKAKPHVRPTTATPPPPTPTPLSYVLPYSLTLTRNRTVLHAYLGQQHVVSVLDLHQEFGDGVV